MRYAAAVQRIRSLGPPACAASLPVLVVGLMLLALAGGGCGVAPVRRDGTPSLPPSWSYAGQHGRPLAYSGGVCAVASPHTHHYPPSPRSAFVETPDGLRDVRETWAFYGPHPHRGRTCFLEGRHLHLEPPDGALVYDDEHAAHRALNPERS
jgi:hypothetical protein